MESHLIQLTSAAQKHGNLNLSTCGFNFFPNDVFGGSTRENPGKEITIKAEGIDQPIKKRHKRERDRTKNNNGLRTDLAKFVHNGR